MYACVVENSKRFKRPFTEELLSSATWREPERRMMPPSGSGMTLSAAASAFLYFENPTRAPRRGDISPALNASFSGVVRGMDQPAWELNFLAFSENDNNCKFQTT